MGDLEPATQPAESLVTLRRGPSRPRLRPQLPDPLVDALERALSPDRVLSRPIDVVAYASDASFYRLVPRVVVQPRSEDEVAALFALSQQHKVPLTFRAAGTSLSGQAVTDGILVDLSRHWDGIEVLEGGLRVRVQPGAIGARVNAVLHRHSRRIGPDPASIDACMIGGILANNASGMCCGVIENAYHTLESIRLLLPSGVVVDTSQPDADRRLRERAPELYQGLMELRDRVSADPALTARIRKKYRIKNTMGYALNALVDFHEPVDMLAHLLIGSEGTLAFIASAVLRTLPDFAFKRTGLLVFRTSDEAFAAVGPLAEAGARAVEFMDHAALSSVADMPAIGVDVRSLPRSSAALLVEWQCEDAAQLEAKRGIEAHVLAGLRPVQTPRFTEEEHERAGLWKVRKGLFPAVGATKRSGESVIIEDVAFPLARQASAFHALRSLFKAHGYGDAIVFGHAKDGNCHFVIKQSFGTAEEIARYEGFMACVADLVVSHEGSLKAEHGTGRNMAPYVGLEWGAEALSIMRDLKAVVDPDRLLNPGVIVNDDPRAHVTHLKALPRVDAEVDRCIECGFCEPVCPSRRLTLTPRQRIVVRREMKRLQESRSDPVTRVVLERDFGYAAIETCAADGLCATACPVGIDTGSLVKRLRSEERSDLARLVAGWLAAMPRALEWGLRFSLRIAHLAERVLGAGLLGWLTSLPWRVLRLRTPVWSQAIPLVPRAPVPASEAGGAQFIYVPSCLSRILGQPRSQVPSLPELVLTLSRRAGLRVWLPPAVVGHCCGLPFGSKGLPDAHQVMLSRLVDDLWGWTDHGRLPVVTDASSCLYAIKTSGGLLDQEQRARLDAMRLLDLMEFAHADLMPRLTVRRLQRKAVLHPTCAARKLGIVASMEAIAGQCADEPMVPLALSCCATAGDRGLLYPELTASATQAEKAEVAGSDGDGHYSNNLTCEIGLREAVGKDYVSLLYLLEEASK
ncbi:MAG: FAD-binding oxidoreductase [Deltaproteobacteria bacterium]|nr:FAD-binding oxidoreductase [Deltaproteobacteria bacterium]